MADWIEPIFDRTPADVTRAKLKVKEWIEALARGESVEISDLKGYINAVDLNRIENDTEYLSMASELKLSIKTDWKRTDLPNVSEINRIIKNIQDLITDFEFGEFTYEMPTTILTYSHANTVEHNLSLIKYLLEDMSARIQAEFSNIDIAAVIEVDLALTLPFETVFEQFNLTTIAKAIKSTTIPVDISFDTLILRFTGKVANSITHPVKMSMQVEFGLSGEVNNQQSNPIIADLFTNADVIGEVNSRPSNPIKQEFNIATMNLDTLYAILTPNTIETLSSMVTDFASEAIAQILTTNEASFYTKTEADIEEVTFSFADMFIESIFSIVSADITSKIIRAKSQKVNGLTETTVQIDVLVGLYAYSKLSDYTERTLGSMDSTTLKDLSYREL